MHARARIDLFLAVVRKVVHEAAYQGVGEQALGRHPLVDDVRRHGFLDQRLVALARPFAANVAVLRKNWAGTMSSFSLTSSPTRTIGWPQPQVVFSGS